MLLALLVISACKPDQLPPITTPGASPAATAVESSEENSIHELIILYTNDEHGWMEGSDPAAAAANLMGLWQEAEGSTYENTLVLSGGDMWTGPAISTWFEGESMVEVMNAMGYDAAAVGNHEFDFGLDDLKARVSESDFPYLSANLRYRSDGTTPVDLGIQPYTILQINGIQVGLIGLTSTSTPVTTHPANVAEFDFIPYEDALRQTVPEVIAKGAELILVPGHLCQGELEHLAQQVGDLGIDLMGGGHCNELFAKEVNGITLIGGGSHMASYAQVYLRFDTSSDTVLEVDAATHTNQGGVADPGVAALVSQWQMQIEAELETAIGYTSTGIQRRSQEMQALTTESWLQAYPADVAISNLGGMRDSLPSGEITLAGIISMMPFDNVIVDMSLSGQQLLRVLALARGQAAIGGVHQRGIRWVLNRSGEEVEPGQRYHLLVNDFMYAGGDDYTLLAEIDPNAYDTGINWRQPVIDWIAGQHSTAESPLDGAVEALVSP